MKKQLSFALLTVSIFTLNTLPSQAASNLSVDDTLSETTETTELSPVSANQWCVTVPYMGSLCWDL